MYKRNWNFRNISCVNKQMKMCLLLIKFMRSNAFAFLDVNVMTAFKVRNLNGRLRFYKSS
jgi:hypothetical protein